jgi:Fic family protein
LSEADHGLSELAGIAGNLPNPHLLISPFMRREAVLSSRIEGTQSSFEDLIAFEVAGNVPPAGSADVQEIVNYVRALERGLALLETLPVSLRLIKEVHAELMKGVRGESKSPGDFRRQQNWIGGANPHDARYVPPPVPEMTEALNALERYLHDDPLKLPPLVRLAIAHYQFETIHPFLDGNGRVGRLLITLTLCSEKLLPAPLLYLSAFLEREKQTYADLLLGVSQEGAWEDWIRFFLRGVAEQSRDGVQRSKRVLDLREALRKQLQAERVSSNVLSLVDRLVYSPTTTAGSAAKQLDVSVPGAQLIIDRLVEAGVLTLMPDTRPRSYVAKSVVEIFRT